MNLAEAPAGALECWCCGQQFSAERLVHLGNHPEVGVCLGCAHFLHQQAHARADQLRPSLAGRMRDQLRRARKQVRDHHWHQQPVIGPALRWLGRYLP